MPTYEEKQVTEIFKALSHPIRQNIILILANTQDNQGMGFTSLKQSINASVKGKTIQVGSIYHHIGLLGSLLKQSSSKTWTLSESGWFAHKILQSTQDRTEFLKEGDLNKSTPFSLVWQVLAPSTLFLYIKRSIGLFIGWLIIFFIVFAAITAEAQSVLVFLFFTPINVNKNFVISLLSIVISWIIFSLTTFLVSKTLLKEKSIRFNDLFPLMIFFGVSLLPLGIFPIINILLVLNMHLQTILSLTMAILLQIWVIVLSARAISVFYFIRLERAAIVSVVSVYVTVLLAIILGF